jgi:hypothetical protein
MTPTLAALQKFDKAHQRGAATLSDVGLMLFQPLQRAWCDATPEGGHIFAGTGGDSVHFCLMETDGQVADASPVMMVVPCNRRIPRMVVGESLRDFLAMGCVTGFFFLEQLTYDYDKALGYLFDFDAFTQHYCGNEPLEDDLDDLAAKRELLAVLSKKFDLKPWKDPRQKLDALQAKWAHLLK